MKAISLLQPWATLIMLGYKHFETRSWATKHRGPLAIAASAGKQGREACAPGTDLAIMLANHNLTFDDLPRGAIVGVCQVDSMHKVDETWDLVLGDVELECGDYSAGRYAWALSHVQPFATPVPCKGALSLWQVPEAVEAQFPLSSTPIPSLVSPTAMSFTSPPDLSKLSLTQPDTSADIIRPRKLGTVNCINVARIGEPITLRYFGASAVGAATGQAHPTQEAAEADVLAWADGKPVAYEQQSVVPLGCVARCNKKAAPLVDAVLTELEALEAIATPGPWLYAPDWLDWVIAVQDTRPGHTDDWQRIAERSTIQPADRQQANYKLIATMRNALPSLLARLRTAEAPKWIAVGDQLPVDEIDNHENPFGTTLVLVARPAAPYVSATALGYRYDGDWFIVQEGSENDFVDNSVTHWQPVPTAPTQSEEVPRG